MPFKFRRLWNLIQITAKFDDGYRAEAWLKFGCKTRFQNLAKFANRFARFDCRQAYFSAYSLNLDADNGGKFDCLYWLLLINCIPRHYTSYLAP